MRSGRLTIRAALASVLRSRSVFRNWMGFLTRAAMGRITGAVTTTRVVTRDGISVRCRNTPMARAPIWEVFASDDYPWSEILAGMPAERPLVLDVGAHVGAFTLALSRKSPDLRAVCFEPSPDTYGYLAANIEENGLGARVVTRPEAVSATAGAIPFWETEPGSCVNSSVPIPNAAMRTVPSVTLDAVVREVDGVVDVLKLDCEGAEHEIVQGTARATWERIAAIFVEFHPSSRSRWSDLRRVLEGHGYSVLWSRHGLQGQEELGLAYLRRAG